MIDGRHLSGGIDTAIREVDGNVTILERRIGAIEDEIDAMEKREMSALRVFSITQISANSKALPNEVARILMDRDAKARSLEVQTAKGRADILDGRARRNALAEEFEKASTARASAEAALRTRFESEPGYVALLAELDRAREDHELLSRGQERAGADLDEKRRAYEEDPLFMYLFRRGHGTSGRRGFGPFAWGDRWLARTIGYAQASASYAYLLRLPDIMTERVRLADARVDAAADRLQEDEVVRLEPIRTEIEAEELAETRLAELDRNMSQLSGRLEEASRFLQDHAEDRDAEYAQAIRETVRWLKGLPKAEMRRLTGITDSRNDDKALADLEKLAVSHEEKAREADRLREEHRELTRRRTGLRDVQSRLSRRGWNDSRHRFDTALAGALLAQLASGRTTSDSFWGGVERSHRAPPPPTPTFPSSGGISSGGFSSGGGFGGGGFGTGGGIKSSGSWSTGGGFGGGKSRSGGGF